MDEVEQFLATGLKRQIDADFAIHDGNPEPRTALWSHVDPVTLFGAAVPVVSGWTELEPTFRWLAKRFAQSRTFDVDLVAAGVNDDLAYTVGFERSEFSFDGGPVRPATLRATHVYRREDGEWRIVHRHGDRPPVDERPAASRGSAGGTNHD